MKICLCCLNKFSAPFFPCRAVKSSLDFFQLEEKSKHSVISAEYDLLPCSKSTEEVKDKLKQNVLVNSIIVI